MQTQTCVVRLTAPLGFTRRWAVVKTWVAFLHGIALTLNLVAGAMVVVGVFLGLRAWCEMHPWKIRFSIRFVLLTTSIIAVGFALRDDVALVTDAFAFWDDLYEIRRFTTLLALDVGFGRVILWVIVRRVRWFAGAASSTDQPTTNHGCTPSHRVILGLGVARSRFLFTIWT
jgi:hypothetical protein